MIRPESQVRPILQQSLTAALFGIIAISGYSLFHSAAKAFDVPRLALCHQFQQLESAESSIAWQSDISDEDESALVEHFPTETDDAQSCSYSQLPESSRIVVRSVVLLLPGVARDCRIPNPDHLIVLPGTPPPVFA